MKLRTYDANVWQSSQPGDGAHPLNLGLVCSMGFAGVVRELEVLVKIQVHLLRSRPHLILVLFREHALPAC